MPIELTFSLILVAINLSVYFKTLNFGLIADDIQWFDRIHKGFFNNRKFPENIKLRLYGGGTFGLFKDKDPNKIDLSYDRLFTILLHTTICILIYLALGRDSVSFIAAILYAVNPINNQTSIWFTGRRYAVVCILVMLMLLFPILSPLFYLLTPSFQFTAVFAPILLAYKSPWYLGLVGVALIFAIKYIKGKILMRKDHIRDNDRLFFTPKRIIIIVKQYGHFFLKMLIPGQCAMTYPKMYFWGITKEGNKDAYSFNHHFYIGIAVLIGSIYPFFWLKGSLLCMWAFMCVAILQWCAIIPVVQDLADRYMSVANMFMMFFLSLAIHSFFPSYTIAIAAAIGAYYTAMTFSIFPMYHNTGGFWEYQRYHFPQLVAPRKYEIDFYIRKQDLMRAWILTVDGLKSNPDDFTLLQYAAICLDGFGEYDAALSYANKALENIYIDQEVVQRPSVEKMIQRIKEHKLSKGVRVPEEPVSRQQRRANERELAKRIN